MGLEEYRRLQEEDRLLLKSAGKLFPVPVSVRTLLRYARQGVKCHISGQKIRLEAFRSGGRGVMTSKQAIQRFLQRINGGSSE